MDYITSPSEKGGGHKNPFVELPAMGDDRKALIVYRGQYAYIVLNKYPYNPGHMLAVPYREVADISDLEVDERNELMELIVRAKNIAQKAMNPDAFNVGFNLGVISGAGIPTHLHAHIVPRWAGDTNFMPVIGKTRTLPQALEVTWEKFVALAQTV